MGLKINESKPVKTTTPDQAPKAVEATVVKLVLATASRYMRGTKLYTDNVTYACTTEVALDMLGWADENDAPIFKRFKAVATKREVAEAAAAPREEMLSGVEAPAEAAPAKAVLSATSDEEEAELFASIEGDAAAEDEAGEVV
jgi:hypothetical protein